MVDAIVNFFSSLFLAFLTKLPASPFNLQTYTDDIQGILPYVNYFVPFYKIAPLLSGWVIFIFASVGIYILIKALLKRYLS